VKIKAANTIAGTVFPFDKRKSFCPTRNLLEVNAIVLRNHTRSKIK
jgi:hypothetical protein